MEISKYIPQFTVLILIFGFIAAGRITNKMKTVEEKWERLRLSTRLFVVIIGLWPFVAFVSPALMYLWEKAAAKITGLGGRYLQTDIEVILLCVLLSVFILQTTMLAVKLNSIEEQV